MAPDMARGAVLLGIALANVGLYVYGGEFGPGHRPADGGVLDRILDFVVSSVVNERSRPMFALLFGFGLATMARRMAERGATPARRTAVLVRRNLLLVAFGAVHAALLFEGDILGVYGVTGLIVLLLMNRRARVQLAWGAISVSALAIVYGFSAILFEPVPMPADYLTSVAERSLLFVLGLGFASLTTFMIAPMLVGVALARAGLLDRPWEHVPRLRRMAVAGVALGLAGGLPYALVVARVWDPGALVIGVLGAVSAVTGIAMGIGYVCLFALWAAWRHDKETVASVGPSTVLAAVGRRSLTCYLLQSVLLAPLLSPWGLAVGERIGSAEAYGIGAAVWLVTVAFAWALETTGHRGPCEVALRRLTYGRPQPQPQPAAPPTPPPAPLGR